MLKIKLARFGKRGQPHYRIVVTEQRSKRDGQYEEAIGTYIPTQAGKPLNIDTKKYVAWLKKGAQPTPTVAALFTRFSAQQSPTETKKASAQESVKPVSQPISSTTKPAPKTKKTVSKSK